MIFGGRPQVPAAAPTPPAAPSPAASGFGNTGGGMGTAMRTYNMGQAQAGATSNPFLNYIRANRAPQAGAGVMNSAPGSAYTLGNTATPLGGGMATGGIDPNRAYTPETIPGAAPLGPPAMGGMGSGSVAGGKPATPPPQETQGFTGDSPADQQRLAGGGAGITSALPNTANPIYTTSAPPAAAPPPSPTWHSMDLTGLNRQESQRARRDMGGLNRLYY